MPRRAVRTGGELAEAALARRLASIRDHLGRAERRVPRGTFGDAHESARNLVHYLALRQYDLRQLQERLADLGLSSLGRAEAHVLYTLEAVIARLGGSVAAPNGRARPVEPATGRSWIADRAVGLFGPPRRGRSTRIMVTLPTEAATDVRLLRGLVQSGMDVVRINCAHDGPAVWRRMIRNLRAVERATHRPCRVEMDLCGPRLRTGPIRTGPAILRLRPARDAYGRVMIPARVRLVPARPGRTVAQGSVGVPPSWWRRRRRGDRIDLRDRRGRSRTLRVIARAPGEIVATCERTVYLANGTWLRARRRPGSSDATRVLGLRPLEGRIRLGPGDQLLLRGGTSPGRARDGTRSSAEIGVTIAGVVSRLRPGDRVWFDGGRIGGVVRGRSRRGARLVIDHAPPSGTWLRADQGINLPDTELGLPPLTDDDLRLLPFVVRHADVVGYSFVQSGSDVAVLRRALRRLGRPELPVLLKIETRTAFEQLPAILLSALRHGPSGVMIARGDLAVEVGFERLAEVQEEILWLCEAAHLPTVWATQVLEGLAKSGVPSRAEVTDAAMGERAECVMLNKGPFLPTAVRALDSIVRRMQAHQSKKSARLRHLRVAERFLSSGPAR